MAEAEPEAAQPKVKVLRRTSISPKYIKADAELQHAATQYLTAIAESPTSLRKSRRLRAISQQSAPQQFGQANPAFGSAVWIDRHVPDQSRLKKTTRLALKKGKAPAGGLGLPLRGQTQYCATSISMVQELSGLSRCSATRRWSARLDIDVLVVFMAFAVFLIVRCSTPLSK
jgi:hypothetical protein